MDVLSTSPTFEFHVQIFTRGNWQTKKIFTDILEADEFCYQMALRTLERCRILRIDFIPIKTFYYAR